MTPWNIIVKERENDPVSVARSPNEHYQTLSLNARAEWARNDIAERLKAQRLGLSHRLATILDFALTIYSADQIISRAQFGFQGWSRHIKVAFPVDDLVIWEDAKLDFENLLSFLSGDKWELQFRQAAEPYTPPRVDGERTFNPTVVSLFSGGLDSFISAIDLLSIEEKPALVSHYKMGSEGAVQPRLTTELEAAFGANFSNFRFFVQPNHKQLGLAKENSSRGRSFLFLLLGVTIANAVSPTTKLIVPENGLISLNIPLTYSRLSSHSTRTTHPYYLKTLKDALAKLGIENPIENPYHLSTKGEMMIDCRDTNFLHSHYSKTLSCSHPDQSRRTRGSRAGIHCGYCLPCIIRQAAEKKAGVRTTTYCTDIKRNPPEPLKKSGADLRAFRMALASMNERAPHSQILQILRSGPLPTNNFTELQNYYAIYQRGMQEVADFLA